MSYISVSTADRHIAFTGQFTDTWDDHTDAAKLQFLQRATDRLEMLQFKVDNPVTVRTQPRYGQELEVPENIQVATALLAGWYGDTPLLKFELQGDSLEQAMSPQVADLPLTVQNLVFPFLTDPVQANDPETPNPKRVAIARTWE